MTRTSPQALGVQVSVLAQDGVQQAELHLNPADMGPVSVQIVDGRHAGPHRVRRRRSRRPGRLIEAGLPELASALRDAGLTLAAAASPSMRAAAATAAAIRRATRRPQPIGAAPSAEPSARRGADASRWPAASTSTPERADAARAGGVWPRKVPLIPASPRTRVSIISFMPPSAPRRAAVRSMP